MPDAEQIAEDIVNKWLQGHFKKEENKKQKDVVETAEQVRDFAFIEYFKNKQAKVNEQLVCPTCRQDFKKKQYSQAFCQRRKNKRGSSCKDVYHNVITEERRDRANNYKANI